jgi:hypothetical protein
MAFNVRLRIIGISGSEKCARVSLLMPCNEFMSLDGLSAYPANLCRLSCGVEFADL